MSEKTEEVAMEEEEEKVEEQCDGGQLGTLSTGAGATTSAKSVQVVKPTLRLDKDTAAAGCTLASEGYNFASMGLSTKVNHLNNGSSSSVNNNNSSEQVGDSNNNSDDRLQQGETPEAEEEQDFEWNEYMEMTGTIPAPPTLFPHVEASLQTLFTEGMKLEVPNRFIEGTYWVSVVLMPCGPLLRLRYEGYEAGERSDDFWCETTSGDIRPLGWCVANGVTMAPPPLVSKKWGDNWMEKLAENLIDAVTVPPYLLEASGCTIVDQIKPGMKFEVQDDLDLTHVWMATVIENVGGRMLLRYDGICSNSHDFWLFYLSFRIHPFGWTRGNECTYKPPTVLLPLKSVQEWASILKDSLSAAFKMSVPPVIFKNQELVTTHEFKEGMKLEALDPQSLTRVCAATVTKVHSRHYFTVQLDVSGSTAANCASNAPVICCHSRTPTIFPAGWAKANHLEVEFWDQGISNEEFKWDLYLAKVNNDSCSEAQLATSSLFQYCSSQLEDERFEMGMKLEAVNPFQPQQMCAATVCKVTDHLLWIQLDTCTSLFPNHVVAYNSLDIFPVGWCESNKYSLKGPSACHQSSHKAPFKKVAIVNPNKQQMKCAGKEDESELQKDAESPGRAWCPVIYVNHKCFTGPFLSISRIAGLPKQVGPGPIHLVLKEIISMIVGVSYLPSRCLSVLQSDDRHQSGMQQQLIKAKYKGKKYRAMVDIVSNSDKVQEYCRSVCKKLQCCANLFGPECFTDNCPENCYSLTKSNPNATIKRKKRRRKTKSVLVKNGETLKTSNDEIGKDEEKSPGEVGDEAGDVDELNNCCDEEDKLGNEDDSCEPPKEKRKYVHRIVPKSDIVTRGAKLPDFALGKRKHKTVLAKLNLNADKPAGNVEHLKTVSSDNDLALRISKKDDRNFKSAFSLDDNASNMSLEAEANISSEEEHTPLLHLESNPLQWNIEQVSSFIRNTDCAPMARLLKEQEIDGQALLLLTLPTIQEHLELKLGPAIKLCHHIEQLKQAFYNSQYGN